MFQITCARPHELLSKAAYTPYSRSLCTPELNQVVGNELLTSGFLEAFGSWSKFPVGQMPVFPLPLQTQ